MIFHLLRLTCFALLLTGLHWLAARPASDGQAAALDIALLKPFLPRAGSLTSSGEPPVWEVRDADGTPIALACMTSPQADQIVGYAGPNNLLLIMDLQGRVTETHWLKALDTHDHVQRVRAADSFWRQFQGRTLGDNNVQSIDGVSGATLTSLAIAEAIDLRLSGRRPSLRFPATATLEEAQGLYPSAVRLEEDAQRPYLSQALDEDNQTLGWLMRTGPLVDNQIGYQGPTELWLAIDREDRVTKIKLRSSFDNEPYVRYTRMEASFWAKFANRTLMEISQMDLAAEGIEGVSGATMTSMAAAATVRAAAERHLKQLAQATGDVRASRRWNWSLGEIVTGLLALLVVPWSFSRQRGDRRWRIAWQALVLIVVVGLSGNLISMALLAGWTRSWPPITLAPGLALLVAISLAMPAFSGRNVYCDHVCPHGIAQQWLGRWVRRRRHEGSSDAPLVQLQLASSSAAPRGRWRFYVHRALQLSAVVIWLLSIGWIVWTIPEQLTFFEPFDVYAWRIGWSVSLAVWVVSLMLAAKEPMGYCRLACPTGKLLDGIRLKRTGKRWHKTDMLLVALTAAIWLLLGWRVS